MYASHEDPYLFSLATVEGIPLAFENMLNDADGKDALCQMLAECEWDGEMVAECFNEAYERGIITCFHWRPGFWDDYSIELYGEDIFATRIIVTLRNVPQYS